MSRCYFDWAASAPAEPFSDSVPFGNPSSKHAEGRAARTALEAARSKCAALLGVESFQLYWTSGGTESNTIALFSLLRRSERSSGAVLAGAAEHASIREQERSFKDAAIPFGLIAPEKDGAVSPRTLMQAMEKQKNTSLIAIMMVNNETGSISDIQELSATARKTSVRDIHFHCDMVQALGKTPFSLCKLDIDSASFSAHKIGGPRGIGLLYLKKPVQTLISGGGQEQGIRSGTENVAGALAFAQALERRLLYETGEHDRAAERMTALVSELLQIKRCIILPECRVQESQRFSPYILQTAFSGIPGEVMVRALDDAGFAVSTGSACSSALKKRPALEAMGIAAQTAFEAIRISQGWNTTSAEIAALIAAIKTIVSQF